MIEYCRYIGRDTFFEGRCFRLQTGRMYRGRVCMDMMFGTVNETTHRAVEPRHDGERGTTLKEAGIPLEGTYTWVVEDHEFVKVTEAEYLAQPHLTNEDLALTGLDGPRGLIS